MSQQNITPTASAVAGALSSSVSLALTYPLTTLTTRQQLRDYKSTHSVVELYAGLQPAVYSTFISNWAYFYCYQLFSDWARSLNLNTAGKTAGLTIATFAGSVNVLLTNPLWLLVTRMQTNSKKGQTSMDALRDILAEPEGIAGLWKGVVPSLLLVSNPAIMFVVYENLLARCQRVLGSKSVPALWIFVIGAVAKLVATILTFPLQLVKSRLQAKQSAGASTSVGAVLLEVVHENGGGVKGFFALYKGLQAKLLQTVLNAALMFTLRDKMTPMAVLLTNPTKAIGNKHS